MNDEACRKLALSPTESFIVQAPAGSGKTELLTQRFLKLLAYAQNAPEEIIAVTFTRKAASEMRHRIIQSLHRGMQEEAPLKTHERTTWELAKAVLIRDQKLEWNILLHPNRLRIVTIDSLCAYIVNKMPILSHFGGAPEIAEFPQAFYAQAVERLLTNTSFEEKWSVSLSKLLGHQDNRIQIISELLINLLKKRDQWLPYLGTLSVEHTEIQAYLKQALIKIIVSHLEAVDEELSYDIKIELMRLIRYAAQICEKNEIENTIIACKDLDDFPIPNEEYLPLWKCIVEFLTTQQDTWRKAFNQKNGFLSPSDAKDKNEKAQRKAQKEAMIAIVEQLAANEKLLPLFADIKLLPSHEIDCEQLEILVALGELLPVLVAHLQVIFQETGKVDFIEVNLRAIEALGDDLSPSDIALNLDYQVRHLLIDEYQDTSVTQYRLFQKLTGGWQQGDGRTLFLVGDPMQSIYKFRGAEVSLFIHTQQHGLGPIKLTPLTLQVNFRSSANIISWLNDSFIDILPAWDDKALGGVSYSKAIASKSSQENSGVNFYPVFDSKSHTQKIADLVIAHFAHHPEQNMAILVRAKKHLTDIIQKLRPLKIPFVAYEVEHLENRSHVIDLVSLLKAILDWTDVVAWYALLRAPWIGLSLPDLYALAKQNQSGILWETLSNVEELTTLSSDGQVRLKRFVEIMKFWLSQRSRKELSQYLKGLWIALGGPDCYVAPQLIDDINKILALIKVFTVGGTDFNVENFESRLSELYADITPHSSGTMVDENAQVKIELMTIHKAKGLEFDTVIMPHLQRKTINHELALLLWYEHPHEEGIDLILAPRRKYQNDHDPLYRYVENQIRKKTAYESARLLYVGATRAKNNLYLVAECEKDENNEIKTPSSSTFLGQLWPHLSIENQRMPNDSDDSLQVIQEKENNIFLKRLPIDYALPSAISLRLDENKQKSTVEEPNIPLESDVLYQNAGIVFHRLMQRWVVDQQYEVDNACVLALKRLGLSGAYLDKAVMLVKQGLHNMLEDAKGRWILSKENQYPKTEWHLFLKNQHQILDYSFIDETGTRWIIDYKLTHIHLDDSALQLEIEKYSPQLLRYKRTLMKLQKHPVRCGLYFPLAKIWWEMH